MSPDLRTPSALTNGERSPQARLFIGCAGWNIPKANTGAFSTAGSHLKRYSEVLSAVEINSSFYRPHRRTTYARWRATVPDDFRFSVKVPKTITHEERLTMAGDTLVAFMEQVTGLDEKLGCLLVQLPPSLEFHEPTANRFFLRVRELTTVMVACEPRHPSWFGGTAEDLLQQHRIARVAADPAVVPEIGAAPGGSMEGVYYRLHGSPRMYYSTYDDRFLQNLVQRLSVHGALGRAAWCMFDNTALGAALENAFTVATAISRGEATAQNV